MADKLASDESQLTTAGLIAHLRLNVGLDLAVSHQADVYAAAADRIEALERALVTARTALEQTEWVGPTLKCPWCDGSGIGGQGGHNDGCKRQQALTEIAGVLGAPCTEHRWMIGVERGPDGILGIQTGGDLFVKSGGQCANCGATEKAW